MNPKLSVLTTALFWLATSESVLVMADPTCQLEIAVRDTSGDLLPCRIHLIDQHGNAQKVDGQPFWHDHFVCSGHVVASLAPGKYELCNRARTRVPAQERDTLEIIADEDQKLHVKLERIANLRAAGWYSGDLHVHRPIDDIEQLMRAEDLDFAPVITWWNNRNIWKG